MEPIFGLVYRAVVCYNILLSLASIVEAEAAVLVESFVEAGQGLGRSLGRTTPVRVAQAGAQIRAFEVHPAKVRMR